MKKMCMFMLLLTLAAGIAFAETIPAEVSARTEGGSYADTSRDDSSKLSVRASSNGNKSWIRFDISSLDVNAVGSAYLKVTLHNPKAGDQQCDVSAVNDDYTTNINWAEGEITWNNAPGNLTTDLGLLEPAQTTYIDTITFTDGVAGDSFMIDVLSILQADTDGVVQFVLHNSPNLIDFATHDHETVEWRPVLEVESIPTGQCPDVGVYFSSYAEVSARTEGGSYADSSRDDSSKLSVRASSNGNKSWIRFDLSEFDIDPNTLKEATLRVTLHEGKGGSQTCDVSVVNDRYTTNIGWAEGDITWNNAPGNLTSDLGLLEPTQTTYVDTIAFTDGVAEQQFEVDVLSALQSDTDGIIQFVLHNSPNLLNFATHDHGGGEAYWPLLTFLQGPAGADNPYPCPGEVVSTDLVGLSWTNPDPNDGVSPITCTVYLGTEPNRPQMDSITLVPGAHTVLINPANFPTHGTLINNTGYYWVVDCDDPSGNPIAGMMWDFYVNNNEPPVVDAGDAQDVWLGKSGVAGQELVNLDGTVSDDGRPNPPAAYTLLWTQVENGAPVVSISPDDTEDTSVTLTEVGDYEFMLTADDGQLQSSDTVRIVVGIDACDASHISTGDDYDAGDVNQDCIVDLQDFVELIAANWMDCTDTLTACGQ